MNHSRRDIGINLGLLIRNARKARGLEQAELAEMVTLEAGIRVSQPTVSKHENGQWSADAILDLPGAYARVLGIPDDQIVAARGHRLPGQSASFAGMVLADPDLDEESKRHLINQYGLLRAATMHNRKRQSSLHRTGRPTRQEIESRTDLPDDIKAMLLAELDEVNAAEDDDEPDAIPFRSAR